MLIINSLQTGTCLVVILGFTIACLSQNPLPVYTDSLQSGFQDWSWATRNLNNTSPVHKGSRSIGVNAAYW